MLIEFVDAYEDAGRFDSTCTSTIRYIEAMTGSAGTTLLDARTRAGLTQSELARRAGVAQSVISAYESGRRQPSLPMLERLISAAGLDLRLRLAARTDRLTGPIGRHLRKNRSRIHTLAADFGVADVRVFGSVARGEERADSDVDLLIDLPPGVGLLQLGRLAEALEALLGTRVDLVPENGLKADVRRRIEPELVSL